MRERRDKTVEILDRHRILLDPSVIIAEPNIFGAFLAPPERNPELHVHAYRPQLANLVQPVARRRSHFANGLSGIELGEGTARAPRDLPRNAARPDASENSFGVLARPALDHRRLRCRGYM